MASSGEESENGPVRLNNRKGKSKLYNSEVIRIARVSGEQYVNHKGKLIPKTQQGGDCRLVHIAPLIY